MQRGGSPFVLIGFQPIRRKAVESLLEGKSNYMVDCDTISPTPLEQAIKED
jgi:hypothetical protein